MTFTHRFALALTASALAFGLVAPAAYAADSMKGDAMMHKHMKKHKAMKGDHMKGGAMKADPMPAGGDTPAQ